MATVRIFRYVEELDAFLVRPEFEELMDLGEHWFDSWDEREALEDRAALLGIDTYDLMILKADPFQNGKDGPCHSPDVRRLFWTDVLKSLELSYELLFAEARHAAACNSGHVLNSDEFLNSDELQRRVQAIQSDLS